MNKNEKIIDIDSSGGLEMVIALTLVDIFQGNLFYYKINTNCSSDYESLGLVVLLWEFFLVSVGSVALLGVFSGAVWVVLRSGCAGDYGTWWSGWPTF